MRAAYERLTALTLLMIEQRIARGFLAHLRKVSKLVREFTQAEWNNHQLNLKLNMLRSTTWRERVLKQLGGEAALARWDRRMARYKIAAETPLTPARVSGWRKTPERIAEELRWKAHAQKCAKATAHPRIFRDPFRVDQEGQFRLAPLPRVKGLRRSPEDVLATTPFYMERYDYNGMPVAKMTGYDAPACVWPAEFRAAAMVEKSGGLSTSVIPHPNILQSKTIGENWTMSFESPSAASCLAGQTTNFVRGDKNKDGALISDDDPP